MQSQSSSGSHQKVANQLPHACPYQCSSSA